MKNFESMDTPNNGKDDGLESPKRRKLLGFIGGVMGVAATGKGLSNVMARLIVPSGKENNTVLESNSSQMKLETSDDCVRYFGGHENDPKYVIVAATELIETMEKENLKEIGTMEFYGANHVSDKADYLRTFIRQHIQGIEGHHYPFSASIIENKKFTIDDLKNIIERAKLLNDKLNERAEKKFVEDKIIDQLSEDHGVDIHK